jgi:hypothetical protein
MVDVKTEVVTPGQRMKARLQRVKDMKRVEGVRVVPADGDGFTADDMRRLLKHPSAGGFRSSGDIEWPNDTFTKRRLREGSIKLAEQKQEGERGRSRQAATQREE